MRRTAFAFAVLTALAACGSNEELEGPAPKDAGVDRIAANPRRVGPDASLLPEASIDAAPFDAGPCHVRLAAVPVVASPHVPDGTPVIYSSNPPSGGPHYNTWANFQEFTHPVEDGYLVHALEHGAVLLLYKCDGAACDPILTALRAVRDAIPVDPLCEPPIRTRIIIAPRAANDVDIAAAAWGYTYRADCVDAVSLTSFILEHYAKGTENFCFPGQVF